MSDPPPPGGRKPAAPGVDPGSGLLGPQGMSNPFVAAVHSTRMPMAITDPRQDDNPLVFVNDAFVALTGYERHEILGRNCRFLQGPDADADGVAALRRAIEERRPIEIDLRNRRKDGTAFWNRLLVAPVFDGAGTLIHFFASQLDVTLARERLATLEGDNAALVSELSERIRLAEEGEARLRLATDAGRLGIWELDLRTGTLLTSGACREHFGRDAARPLDFPELLGAVHPADRERFRAAILDPAPGEEDAAGEFRVSGPGNGPPAWVEVRARPVQDRAGKRLVVAGTSARITARKRGEERRQALLDLDERFRALDSDADLAREAAAMLGSTLGVDRAGYGAVDHEAETVNVLDHWSAARARGIGGTYHLRRFGSFVDALKRGETVVVDDAERAAEVDPAALAALGVRAIVNVPIVENGRLVAIFFLNDAAPRAWAGDELAFVHDVANRTSMAVARRRAEAELRAVAASLEEQVALRTGELMEAEAALRQSQKMEAVGQLTGGLAHDFNNLLTGISGSLEMLRRRVAAGRMDGLDRLLEAAEGSARRAAALTHRLLAFSRRQTLEPRAADVGRLAAGMEELISRTVGPGIAVVLRAEAAPWNTLVDPGQLENALLNLCINARDAMPDGGTLEIATANRTLDAADARGLELPAGDYVRLRVADTGTGMTPEVIAKAFDPFFTTKPLGQGTGLGLSMIYGFARQSGGQVRIESEPGRGTAVFLFLPRHGGAEAEPAAVGGDGEAGDAAAGEAVLVIDDEAAVRMLVSTVLDEAGYAVLEAADGAEGLAVLRSTARIDVLVTDVGLPGGTNGRQVADAARVLRPGLKVLFITGYAETAALGSGHPGGGQLEPGMRVLTKPFALDTLLARVRGLLAGE